MKRIFMAGFLSLILVALLVWAFPMTSQAADDEHVLDSISHSSATNTVDLTESFSATLIVPYAYSGTTLNLANGRDIDWDDSVYSTVSASFSDIATVDGPAVTMTVTYVRVAEPLATYSTDYSVNVVRAEPEPATFTGPINKTVTFLSTSSYALGSSITGAYDGNDEGALTKIVINGSNPAYGSLKLGDTPYVMGSDILYSQLSSLKFEPTALGESVSYEVYAYNAASPIAVNSSPVFLNISIDQKAASDITYSIYKNKTQKFAATDFNTVCQAVTGKTLNYVRFSSPSSGTLYYNYSASGSNTPMNLNADYNYSATEPAISNVTFLPATDYTGNVTINYAAHDIDGNTYNGSIKITVKASVAADITYTIDQDEVLKFSSDNLTKINTACSNLTGYNFNYIAFTLPSSNYGKLYYKYTSSTNYDDEVESTDKYYRGSSPYLSDVSFVPKSGYNGTVTIAYSGQDAQGTSYTGSIKITVGNTTGIADIKYTIDEDEELVFDEDDFNDVCDDYTNDDLEYVKFSTPSSGNLYYDYSSSSDYEYKIDSSDKFYYAGSSSKDYLSKVSYVPKSGYSGTVTITYNAYPEDAASYTGKIKITVGNGGIDYITYKTDEDEAITFDEDDFGDVCDDYCNDDLDYVKFSSVSSSNGYLYYDYDEDDTSDTKVSTSYEYYFGASSSQRDLDKITFVPKTGYSGTVTITYTAYPEDAASYTGKIKITVGDAADVATISYSVNNASYLTFNAADFNKVCDDYTDEALSYVKFTLPSNSFGKLYYDYSSANDYDSSVSAGSKYYYKSTSPYISKVAFVAKAGYTGTLNISYTGYSTSGESYSGLIKITVTGSTTPPTGTGSAYFTDVTSSYAWAAPSIDYLYSKGIVAGTSVNQYGPKTNITRADFIVMLVRAFNLKATGTTTAFTDVKSTSYYYSSVMIAKALGIAEGSGGYYYPTSSLTREDAMVLVLRTLKVVGKKLTAGTSSDLASFTDRNQISTYAYDSVATLVKAKIITGTSAGILSPKGNITRAEMAVILYRILTTL